MSLLKSRRLRLTADIYNRLTTNLFLEKPISSTSGFDYLYLNTGSMRNKGVELDVQGDVVKNNHFTWTIGANFSYNKNEVTDLGGLDEFESGYTGIVRVGLPYGSHYAPKWAGVDPQTGNPLYYDKEGKTTTVYNASSLSVADFGTYFPSITGGFNTSFSYKDFYLNALFSFATDVYRYNNEDYYNENPSFVSSNQSTRMLYDRWKKPGDQALLPRIGAKRSYSSKDIQDASYLRLRNVNLGYSVPASWIQRAKVIQGIKVFVQAQNLLTWTKWKGFDPENGNEYAVFNYPAARTYTFGLNVNF